MKVCEHGKGPTELTIAVGVMSGKGSECSCCHRDWWTWGLDENGLCPACAVAPSVGAEKEPPKT
jgi:hypothetical protein